MRANMLKLIENFCGIAEGPAFGDCTKVPTFIPGTIIRPLAGSGAASLIERKTNEHRTLNVQLAKGEQALVCLWQIEHRIMYSARRELLCRTVYFIKKTERPVGS